jgi:hypothetical protein
VALLGNHPLRAEITEFLEGIKRAYNDPKSSNTSQAPLHIAYTLEDYDDLRKRHNGGIQCAEVILSDDALEVERETGRYPEGFNVYRLGTAYKATKAEGADTLERIDHAQHRMVSYAPEIIPKSAARAKRRPSYPFQSLEKPDGESDTHDMQLDRPCD